MPPSTSGIRLPGVRLTRYYICLTVARLSPSAGETPDKAVPEKRRLADFVLLTIFNKMKLAKTMLQRALAVVVALRMYRR